MGGEIEVSPGLPAMIGYAYLVFAPRARLLLWSSVAGNNSPLQTALWRKQRR